MRGGGHKGGMRVGEGDHDGCCGHNSEIDSGKALIIHVHARTHTHTHTHIHTHTHTHIHTAITAADLEHIAAANPYHVGAPRRSQDVTPHESPLLSHDGLRMRNLGAGGMDSRQPLLGASGQKEMSGNYHALTDLKTTRLLKIVNFYTINPIHPIGNSLKKQNLVLK